MSVEVVAITLVARFAYIRNFNELIGDVAFSIMIIQTPNMIVRCWNQYEIEIHFCIQAKLILKYTSKLIY